METRNTDLPPVAKPSMTRIVMPSSLMESPSRALVDAWL